MFSAPLVATPVTWSDGVTEFLIVGDEIGKLTLVRHLFDDVHFNILASQELGGSVAWVGKWEYGPLADRGFVVTTTNPDKLHFVEIAYSSPHIRVLDSIDLMEDPGSVAFLGPDEQGRQQLAVSLPGIDQILVLREETGQWSISQTVDAGDDPWSLVAVDMDQDGMLELVTADRGFLSGTLSVFGCGLDGVFTLREQVHLSEHASQVRKSDFNLDGLPELVVSYRGLAQLDILTCETGHPVLDQSIPTTAVPDFFEVVSSPTGGFGLVAGFRDQGMVDFILPKTDHWEHQDSFYVGCRPVGAVTCDLNGDGMSELACVGGTDNVLGILLGNSLPGFWGYSAGLLPAIPLVSHLDDFDANGTLDLVVGGGNPSTLSLFMREIHGSLLENPLHSEIDFYPGTLTSADFFGDAKKELLITDLFSSRLVLQVYSEGGGFLTHSTLDLAENPGSVTADDVDADGFMDIVLTRTEAAQVEILFGDGDGSFEENLIIDFTSEVAVAVAVALDPGSHLDLLVSDGQNRIWSLMNLDGRSFGPALVHTVDPGPEDLCLVDLDGDSDLDVVVTHVLNNAVTFLENNYDGSLVSRPANLYLGGQPTSIKCGDLDGDSIPDLLMTLEDSDRLWMYLASGVWQYAFGSELPGSGHPVLPQLADFNSDGRVDVLALDDELLLAMIMLNTELSLVAVDPAALAVDCDSRQIWVRIALENFEPWELAVGSPGHWHVLAADGRARIGRLFSDGNQWVLTAGFQEMDFFQEPMTLRLAVGRGAEQEFLTLDLNLDCSPENWALPQIRWLDYPWPNPFNPRIQGRIQLDTPSDVDAGVFDLAGRRVATLLKGSLRAGIHDLSWDGRQDGRPVAGGLYLLHIQTDSALISQKIILLK